MAPDSTPAVELLARRLRALVQMSANLDFDSPGCLSVLEDVRTNPILVSWSEWETLKSGFTVGETVILIQALTVAEREFGWPGGSVSSVICLMQELWQREQVVAGLLCDWVARRTHNDYLPLGNHGSRSEWISSRRPCLDLRQRRDQLHRYGAVRASQIEARRERHREAAALAARAEEEKARYITQKFQAHGTSEPAKTSAAISHIIDRLRLVALDRQHSLAFFPKDWARVDPDVLLQIDPECRAALTARLEGTKIVSWNRLLKRLIRIQSV
jgi:hypothetical protein